MFKRSLLTLVVIALFSPAALFAQGRFKTGIGINYISNDNNLVHLNDYFAPSLHFSYDIIQSAKIALTVESGTSLRTIDNNSEKQFGFTSSLPLILSYKLKNINIFAGAGPSYIKQTAETYLFNESTSGYFINTLAGVSFKGKPIFADVIYPEYNIRLSYVNSFDKPSMEGGWLSLIVFLRGKK